mmetsp:Transcript_25034/g.47482  ORF Transcript_25034/g.47482 Transcript_25034/m.47482 type:complete len:1631 (-) Transcript_25034:133-5025(-)
MTASNEDISAVSAADNPPPLTEEPFGTAAAVDSKGDQTEAHVVPIVSEPFIQGLVILPPRQKACTPEIDATAMVALPPLRAEEPVASIRAALAEVVGYAHLTKYRLVVEKRMEKPSNGASNKKGNLSSGAKKDWESDKVVSEYTLKDAMVTISPSVKTLEIDNCGGKEESKRDELILDEYGDLTVLLPLLKTEDKQGEGNGKESEKDSVEAKHLDASHFAIRVVLEKYDLAAARDHVVRVRQLLMGNAPHVRSLMPDDEEGGTLPETAKVENGENDAMDKAEGDKSIKEPIANVKKEEELKAKEELAKILPKYPSNYDLSLSKATTGGDLADFYFLACGEETTLLHLRKEMSGSDQIDNKGDLSVDENCDKANSVKKSNRNKKNKKNKNSSSADAEASNKKELEDDHSNLVETERLLYQLNSTTNITCTIRLSGYHAPPAHRRFLGDLAYFEAALPGGSNIHITAFSLGFYINRSTSSRFDPTPAKDPCYSHALLDCLLQKSKQLRFAWLDALSASKERAELLRTKSLTEDSFASLFRPAISGFSNNSSGSGSGGGIMIPAPSMFTPRVDSILVRPPWIVNMPFANDVDASKSNMDGKKLSTWDHEKMHEWNAARAEEELTQTFGMDVRGGGLRDWNEELQSAREMPVETLPERIERARLIHKVMSDFGDAALAGVKSIFDGYITPMNPNEPTRAHVFLHNNIFFSRAVDAGLETFKICQGDSAARKSASRDAHNMGVLHRLDIPGLHTLATVLVDYMGTRFVCQSIVPGILYGEKAHTLTYGAVEALSELQYDEDMHKLLESSIGEGCMVATRKIPAYPLTDEKMLYIKNHRSTPLASAEEKAECKGEDAKKNTITSCGPVEMKGIVGSDKRKYVLDCTRLTPRDANWVPKLHGGTGYWEDKSDDTNEVVPPSLNDDEWIMCVLRPELVTQYAEMKINNFLQERALKMKQASEDSKEVRNSEVSQDAAVGGITDTTDESKVEDKNKNVGESKDNLANAEEEYIRSLQYNVNVFLPSLRSIETIDKDAYDQLHKDEEEARELARHLWDTVMPALTKDIRLSSGNGLQIPADGKSLTEFIHQRGINCRYFGRLAELAQKEEQDDVAAEKAMENKDARLKLQRYKMPLSWLELLECEMVARAAKHVLDSYMREQGGVASAQPAQTIASFLSALVSIGEESAAETEIRMSNLRDALDEDDMNALTMCGAGGNGDAVRATVRGRADVWADIEREVGRRYRYTLCLYNGSNTKVKDALKNRALFTPLLRRICQRTGIRLVGKKYDVGGKCVCGGANSTSGRLTYSYPIAPVDILDILPLIKHAAAVSGETFVPCPFYGSAGSPSLHVLLSDAKAMYEHGHAHMNAGNLSLALEYSQEAASLYQRVVETPLHSQISRCLKLISAAHFHGDDHAHSIASAAKYLAVSVSLGGFDCAEALNAHISMANSLLTAGRVKQGLKHLRAMQFLMELMTGPNYSEISSTYYKIGAQYYECGRVDDALRFYKLAAACTNDDRMIGCIISRSTAMALVRVGKFKEAYEIEKKAYQSYTAFLGDEHDATKASLNAVMQFMQLAVEQGKVKAVQEQKLTEQKAADAVADQIIKADEDADEGKKKKKKSKKKKKKPAAVAAQDSEQSD